MSHRQLIRVLQRDGWIIVGQRGSHLRLAKRIDGVPESISVPRHAAIKKGALHAILQDAEISRERFLELL